MVKVTRATDEERKHAEEMARRVERAGAKIPKLSVAPTAGKRRGKLGADGPLNYLHGYVNAAPPRPNCCGQAAIATAIDYLGLNPYNLDASVFDPNDGQNHWDNDTVVNDIQDQYPDRWAIAIGEVGMFPQDVSDALTQLSGATCPVYWAGDGDWQTQWNALQSRLVNGWPTIVLLDAGALGNIPFSGHYVVAYNYDDANGVCITNSGPVGGNPWIGTDAFLKAWACHAYPPGFNHILIDFVPGVTG